jgi:hypothetical protein
VIDVQEEGGKFVLLFAVDVGMPTRWMQDPWFSDIKTLARKGKKLGWTTVVMIGDEKIPVL